MPAMLAYEMMKMKANVGAALRAATSSPVAGTGDGGHTSGSHFLPD